MHTAYKINPNKSYNFAPELKAGQVVFRFTGDDKGVVKKDTELLDVQCIAIAVDPLEKTKFYSVPLQDLTPVLHHEMVASLAKPPAQILSSVSLVGLNLLHMSVGIADEYFEWRNAYSPENVLEELGDMLFYTEGILLGLGLDHDDIAIPPGIENIDKTLGNFFETVKRIVFYEQGLQGIAKNGNTHLDNLISCYAELICWIEYAADVINKTLDDVRDHNQRKLGVRYAGFAYSDKAATERVDKTEDYAKDKADFNDAQSEFALNPDIETPNHQTHNSLGDNVAFVD